MSANTDILLTNGTTDDTFYPSKRLGNTSHLYVMDDTTPLSERESLLLTSGNSASTGVRRVEMKYEMPYTFTDSDGNTQSAFISSRLAFYIPESADAVDVTLARKRMGDTIADDQTLILDVIDNDAFPY